MKTASQWVDDYMEVIGVENVQAARDNEPEHVRQSEEMFKAIQKDALLEAAEIASDHLYVGQEDSTGRKIYDAILARAKEVEDK